MLTNVRVGTAGDVDDTEIHVDRRACPHRGDGVGDVIETEVASEVVERSRRHGDEHEVSRHRDLRRRAQRPVATCCPHGDRVSLAEDVGDVVIAVEQPDLRSWQAVA